MHNKFIINENYFVKLLCNIQEPYDDTEYWRNSITLEIETDSTADQYVVVTGAEGYSETYNLTPGQLNTVSIGTALWNYGGFTTVEFYKNNTLLNNNTLYITFPDIVEGSGAISSDFQIDGIVYLGQNYTMAGSYYADPGTVKELEQKVETVEDNLSTMQGDVSELKTDVTDLQSLITISNVDLTPGTSPLETGHIYLVYE